MAANTEPRNGIKHGWTYGDDNWDGDVNANFKFLGLFGVQPSVKDRDLATPPGSPAVGDAYIVAASPTGAWVGHTNHIAVWYLAEWVFCIPRLGWLVYIEDEEKVSVFKTAWSAGVAI